MNAILNNLFDPAWWFSGVFFVVIAYLLPKIIQSTNKIPFHTRGFIRKLKLSEIRKIKKIRFDDTKILIESINVSAWLVIFVLSAFIVFYGYLTNPFALPSTIRIPLMLVSFLPIYIVEIKYLLQREFFNRLIKARDRIKK